MKMTSPVPLYFVVSQIFALYIYLNTASKTEIANKTKTSNRSLEYDRELEAWVNVKNRLIALEAHINNLQKQVDQIVLRNEEVTTQVTNCLDGLAMNTKIVVDVLNKTGYTNRSAFLTHINDTSCPFSSLDKKKFPRNIVEAINNRQFTYAQEMIANMHSVDQVTENIYEDTEFDLIIELSKNLTAITPSLQLLRGLYFHVVKAKRPDIQKLMIICTNLQVEVFNQQNLNNFTRTQAKDLLDLIVGNIIEYAADNLTNAMKNSVYLTDPGIMQLSVELSLFKPDINRPVVERVINKTYGILPLQSIFDNIVSHKSIIQKLTAFVAIFWKLKADERLEQDVILDVAANLSDFRKTTEYTNFSVEQIKLVDDLIKQLPICVRNLFFEETFSLWNQGGKGYLFAAAPSYAVDSKRRKVFIWMPGNIVFGSCWKVEKNKHEIYFRNNDRNAEYLYADASNFDVDSRNVFTWMGSDRRDKKFAWNLEIYKDYCHIKSAQFEEHLYSSWLEGQQDMKHALTWKTDSSFVYTTPFQWEIRPCV